MAKLSFKYGSMNSGSQATCSPMTHFAAPATSPKKPKTKQPKTQQVTGQKRVY